MVEESSQIKIESKATFRTKGFIRWGLWTNISIIVIISMIIMYGSIVVGLSIYISITLLLGTMFGMIQLLSGKTIYTISAEGFIRRYNQPGEDLNRSRGIFSGMRLNLLNVGLA